MFCFPDELIGELPDLLDRVFDIFGKFAKDLPDALASRS
jgi:hypothetical protein